MSIYEVVREDAAAELPDEPTGTVRWAAGAKDGVLLMHTAFKPSDDGADAVLEAIRAYLADSSAWDALYGLVRDTRALPVLDPLLRRVAESGLPRAELRELALRLATTADDREPVKYGLALLGLSGVESDADVARVLAGNDEFTLPAFVALSRLVDDRWTELWELAKRVRGWGRIHLVERLATSERPDILRWILVEGFRNDVMDEYLALTAAEAGGLADALADDPDDEVLAAACDLIGTLLAEGGPAGAITDYADGVRAVTNLLAQLEKRASTLTHLRAVYRLLAADREDWPAELAATCRRIIDWPRWGAVVDAGLAAEEQRVYMQADWLAGCRGVDTTELRWRRLLADPTEPSRWYPVVQRIDTGTVERIVALAEQTLPLRDDIDQGERWHMVLSMIVAQLAAFPGQGWPLIDAALCGPSTNNHSMAVNALNGWGLRRWPAEAPAAIAVALDRETDEKVRARLVGLIS